MNRLTVCVFLLIYQIDLIQSDCERIVDENRSKVKCYEASLTEINAVRNSDTVNNLDIHNGFLKDLPKNTFNYPKLSTLKITYSDIQTVTTHTFNHMPSLSYLDLSNNRLKSLPSKLFENNFELRILNISNNEIISIHKDTFARLPDLIELNLSHNNLTTAKDIFTSLIQLQIINLSWNRIQNIESKQFENNLNLKKVLYDFNPITELNENIFEPNSLDIRNYQLSKMDQTSPIIELHISNCHLTSIQNHSFAHLKRLKYLNIQANLRITDLEPDAFNENIALESLRLSHNSLKTLPLTVFNRLRNLKNLWLKGNYLSQLPADIFKYNTNLKELDLGGNQITQLDSNVFRYLTNLETLDLFANRLTKVPKNVFKHLVELKYLTLFRNRIGYIEPGSFDQLKHLKTLILDQNNLTAIEPNTFLQLSELNVLRLGLTGLTDIKFGTFSSFHEGYADETSRILDLRLEANRLTHLSYNAFAPLSRLIALDVSYNRIATIDVEFFKLMGETLTVLKMRGNRFTDLPAGVFDNLQNVVRLDLNRNLLTQLDPNIFQNMFALTTLDLSNNKFQIIPSGLFNVPQLRQVKLAENELTHLASNIFEGEDCIVEELNIEANKLTYLESDVLKRSKLKYLRFGKNPWQCGCLNDMMMDIYRLNIDFSRQDYFDGVNPACVVTNNNTCLREAYLNNDLYKSYFSVKHSVRIFGR